MRAGFRVLRLRGIDQAQEFVDIEAGGNLAQQAFQFDCSLSEAARFVLSYSGLEFAVEMLAGTGFLLPPWARIPEEPEQQTKSTGVSWPRLRMLPPRWAGGRAGF
jgi:hypothetical protein